jgi:hypothetical protein
MGRRPSGALPVMRRHKPTNTARIIVGVNHPELSLPKWPRLRGAGQSCHHNSAREPYQSGRLCGAWPCRFHH